LKAWSLWRAMWDLADVSPSRQGRTFAGAASG
jgi:hypothetical protein